MLGYKKEEKGHKTALRDNFKGVIFPLITQLFPGENGFILKVAPSTFCMYTYIRDLFDVLVYMCSYSLFYIVEASKTSEETHHISKIEIRIEIL